MFAARDQENLANAHHTTAASKPLNQGLRSLQPKTPGNSLKTPFLPRNDENKLLGTAKGGKNLFVTPAPKNRAPLGAKTTNAKAFKTPAPGQKPSKQEQPVKQSSTGRRSARSKIQVAPSEPVHTEILQEEDHEEDDEPDYGYAPPPIVPLPDPPIELNYDHSFPQFQGENFMRGWGEIYFASPTDENGISLRVKREEEFERKAIEWQDRELKKAMEASDKYRIPDSDEEVEAKRRSKAEKPRVNESQISTLKARSAAAALSVANTKANTNKLPTAVLQETASSKQKRKPLFSVSRDANVRDVKPTNLRSAPLPVSKTTIGFPKAKKAPSILPSPERVRSKPAVKQAPSKPDAHNNQLEFVDLYGEPPAESEIWSRLQERRRQRRGDNTDADDLAQGIFEMEIDNDLDQELRAGLDVDDYQLPMPEDD